MSKHRKSDDGRAISRERFTVRIDPVLRKEMEYWRKIRDNKSENEYIAEAIELKIAHENKDYDLPVAEIMRLNQLIDGMAVLSRNVAALERVVVAGFDGLMTMTRGDNYLAEEDGEV